MITSRRRRILCAAFLTSVFGACLATAQLDYAKPYSFTTLAGAESIGTADGTGSAARFKSIEDLALSPSGDLYVADAGTIRKVTRTGVVTTVTGRFRSIYGIDGPVENAKFPDIGGITVDGSGNLYVTLSGRSMIYKIADGIISTVFSNDAPSLPPYDALGSANHLASPRGIIVDAAGNLYVTENRIRIRKITPAGVVSVLAGNTSAGHVDGTGTAALFSGVDRLAIDASGNLYAADGVVIRKITPSGVVTTIAGVASPVDPVSLNDGAAATARFRMLQGIARDAAGNLYVSDDENLVRKISVSGVVSTLGGKEDVTGISDGVGSDARFFYIGGLAVDSAGALYAGDLTSVRRGVAAGPPAITTQPQNQTVTAGDSVQFSVAATGTPDPTYQWYFNGGAFSGATSATLKFTNARTADAGDYTVTVTNTLGSITSSKATLTVNAATTPPSGGGSSGGTGGSTKGGGGGAPSLWFILVVSALGLHQLRLRPGGER